MILQAQGKYYRAKERTKKAEDDKAACRADYDQLIEQIEILHKQENAFLSEIPKVKEDNESLREHRDKLQVAFLSLSEAEQLRQDVQDAKQENGTLKAQINTASIRANSLEQDIKDIKKENGTLKTS